MPTHVTFINKSLFKQTSESLSPRSPKFRSQSSSSSHHMLRSYGAWTLQENSFFRETTLFRENSAFFLPTDSRAVLDQTRKTLPISGRLRKPIRRNQIYLGSGSRGQRTSCRSDRQNKSSTVRFEKIGKNWTTNKSMCITTSICRRMQFYSQNSRDFRVAQWALFDHGKGKQSFASRRGGSARATRSAG